MVGIVWDEPVYAVREFTPIDYNYTIRLRNMQPNLIGNYMGKIREI